MKEHPILFSTPMIQAILTGKKRQTRRIPNKRFECAPGDVLWVRETWNGLPANLIYKEPTYWYKADEDLNNSNPNNKWRPSIYMPRKACRLFLQVKAVRTEFLWDISEEDIIREGFESIEDFKALWDKLNVKRCLGPRGKTGLCWGGNPLVTVIEFERKEGVT